MIQSVTRRFPNLHGGLVLPLLAAATLLGSCVLEDPIGAERRGSSRGAGVDRTMDGLTVKEGPDGGEQVSVDRSIEFGERSEVEEMLRPDGGR